MLKKSLTLFELLDRAKEMRGLDSDRQLDRMLGYNCPMISQFKTRNVLPSKEKMIELAHLIDMPEQEALMWLGLWEAQKKHEEHAAAVYEKMLDLLKSAGKAAAVIVAVIWLSLGSREAMAGTHREQITTVFRQAIHYAINGIAPFTAPRPEARPPRPYGSIPRDDHP